MTDTEDGQFGPGDSELDSDARETGYHHNPFVRELQRLKKLDNPHMRGYDFEELIASLFRRWHFNVTSSPGTARPRQTDLLAVRGSSKYLIEVKWRESKADIDDIDSLFSRMEAAPADVVGLMVSFSGFTATAIEKVEQRSDRPILLIKGEELERLIEWEEDLAHLLVRKKDVLLSNRRVLFLESIVARASRKPGKLASAPAEFVYLDGTRSKSITGMGRFGEFTFVQELPDIDWTPGGGRGVALDMELPVYSEHGILFLLQQLSDMGWATKDSRWSIQQSETNWHGMGMSAFGDALQAWHSRYEGIPTHHSEEFCYFDVCDGGFYCLTANISAHESRMASRVTLSFQLIGIPLDTDHFKELIRDFSAGTSYYFRPMKTRSVKKARLRNSWQIPLEPVAFIVQQDEFLSNQEDWVRGIVAKNPFWRPDSTPAGRRPDWMPSQVFDSELLICDLRSWHPLSKPKQQYELWGSEHARTAEALIVHPIAEWSSKEEGPVDETPPRILSIQHDTAGLIKSQQTPHTVQADHA